MDRAFPWSRLGLALGSSLFLHLALLLAFKAPEFEPRESSTRLSVLLVPLGRPAPPASSAVPALAPPVPEQRPATERKAPGPSARQAPKPAEAQPSTIDRSAPPAPAELPAQRGGPNVSMGPLAPRGPLPESRLADAARYTEAERLSAYPQLAAPFKGDYPRRAFEERRRGVVLLQLMIDEAGKVVEALPLPGDVDPDLVQAALAAARLARFKPGEAGSRPVKARAYFAVSFVIE